jgi:hypothetical protein
MNKKKTKRKKKKFGFYGNWWLEKRRDFCLIRVLEATKFDLKVKNLNCMDEI